MKTRGFFGKFATVAAIFTAGALALSGCAGGDAGGTSSSDSGAVASNGDKVKVDVAMPTQALECWIADGNAVKEDLEVTRYEVDLRFANDDIPTQTQQADQIITNGATTLVIASIGGTALSNRLDTAGSKNIPVVAYDCLIRDDESADLHVSFDNFKVGVAQGNTLLYGLGLINKDGKELDNTPKGPLNIEFFAGSPDNSNTKFFFDSAVNVLKPYLDDDTLVAKSGQTSFNQVVILHWQQEVAQKHMEGLLTSTYDGGSEPLAGVLLPFDGISHGIITTLRDAGYDSAIRDGLLIVTGQDTEVASTKMINDGIQQSTISKDTHTLAAQAVTVIKAMAEGKEPGANDAATYNSGVKVMPFYLLEVETIYAGNLKEELTDFGYFTQADVDAGVVKK